MFAVCCDPLRKEVCNMKDREIIEFESKVKSTLEWSGLDAKTKSTLWKLMTEVSTLIEKSSH